MRINKIILENYGLYRGLHVFNLAPRTNLNDNTPIVLFGGRNGAGKTTFLNSIRLALYGKRSLGDRISQKQYHEFLLSKIHRDPNGVLPIRSARVAIEFAFVSQGELNTYYIERGWTNNHNQINEYLKILKDDEPLDQIDTEFWDSFISDIIPERLSQLFFFDGEKIQEIADDIKGNAAIADAIQTLLGLDLIDKLQSDLKIYKSREANQFSSEVDRQQLLTLEESIKTYNTEIAEQKVQSDRLRTEISGLENSVKNLEDKLRTKGADFANAREGNKIEMQVINTRIEELEQSIYRECADLFPLTLCPSAITILEEQINDEEKLNKQKVLANEVNTLKDEIDEKIQQFTLLKDDSAKSELISLITQSFKKCTLVESETIELLGFSPTESQSIRSTLKQALKNSASTVVQLSNELEKQHRKLTKVQNTINQAPDGGLLEDELNLITYHNQQIGELRQKLKKTEDSIKSLAHQKKLSIQEKHKLENKQKEYEGFQKRANLVDNINNALKKYHKQLTDTKIEILREKVVECFNIITRKSGFVSDVTIDSKTFEVVLFDAKGKAIPKEDLSSGEKQIFAISFLWALAKTSGRPLPVIIDTPLGRLDSEHRENLIKNYFPKASHQTILFSTDTEVDEELFAELSPHISHCYHLYFDKENFQTTPKEEYFWEPAEVTNA